MTTQTNVLHSFRAAGQSVRAFSLLLTVAAAIPVLAPPAPAQTTDVPRAIVAADRFLRTEARGKETLSYLHFGADYHGHEYQRTVAVVDGNDREIPGKFALVYRFYWEKDGITDLAFLCDEAGYVYKVQVMYTNAVLSQPFMLADATIQLLGNALIAANRDKMSPFERKVVQKIVDSADAKALLEWSLSFEQHTGQ